MKGFLIRHLVLWLAGAAIFRLAVVPPEACPVVNPGQVRAAAVAAGDWLAVNLDDDGRFLYGYDRSTKEINPSYNIVRHAGATNSLYQLAAAGETQFLAPADRALDYLLDMRIDHQDWTAIAEPGGRVRLGTVGFAVVALVERRAITGDHSNDELLRALGRFIVGQQQPEGSLLAFWDPRTERASPGEYGKFATGEAVWALVELHQLFPEDGWWVAAQKTLHYLADGSRPELEGYRARLPDHWAAYALQAAGSELLDDQLIGYAERLAGYFSARLRLEAQRSGSSISVMFRGYPGPPAGVGTAAEGLAELADLAARDERLGYLADDMGERLRCVAGTMVESQAADTDPGEQDHFFVQGAWFYRSYTQVDDQQHVLSGLLGAERAMERGRG